jgi:hypothetical protein
MKIDDEDCGRLEWNPLQMAFHFAEPSDKKVQGWDTVVDRVHPGVSGEFISFLNKNWKDRQRLPTSEIKQMFETWTVVRGGCNG